LSSPSAIPHADGPRPDPALGVFETLLVRDGRPLELEPHLARLDASLRALYGAPTPATARALVLERAAGERLARLRLTIAPGPRGLVSYVAVAPVDPASVLPGRERAVDLAPLVIAGGIGAHKWADRRLLAGADAAAAPGLPLLVDRDGAVLEVSRGNVFLVRDGAVVTPAADGRILPGVTRRRVLQLAETLGLMVREEPVALDRLADAEELFITGAVRGIEPVGGCAGTVISPEGETTATLACELRELWARDDDLSRQGGAVHARVD
jgi:para-aminobenzoate synthetase / 4-amino-4-deoxychorismate lyase